MTAHMMQLNGKKIIFSADGGVNFMPPVCIFLKRVI